MTAFKRLSLELHLSTKVYVFVQHSASTACWHTGRAKQLQAAFMVNERHDCKCKKFVYKPPTSANLSQTRDLFCDWQTF